MTGQGAIEIEFTVRCRACKDNTSHKAPALGVIVRDPHDMFTGQPRWKAFRLARSKDKPIDNLRIPRGGLIDEVPKGAKGVEWKCRSCRRVASAALRDLYAAADVLRGKADEFFI